jgi:4'-phosphopantetheinyl transferase
VRAEVDLWRVEVERVDSRSVESILADDERARAARFRFDIDRRRYVACRAALRSILGARLHVPRGSLQFAYGEFGKPSIDPAHGVFFNVSHTTGLGLVALSSDVDVGVDVERLRLIDDHIELAKSVFSAVEQRDLALASDPSLAFLRGWTRKEAYAKARGGGLSDAWKTFTVTLGSNARLDTIDDDPQEASAWSIVDASDTRFVIALAARARGLAVREHGFWVSRAHVQP